MSSNYKFNFFTNNISVNKCKIILIKKLKIKQYDYCEMYNDNINDQLHSLFISWHIHMLLYLW